MDEIKALRDRVQKLEDEAQILRRSLLKAVGVAISLSRLQTRALASPSFESDQDHEESVQRIEQELEWLFARTQDEIGEVADEEV